MAVFSRGCKPKFFHLNGWSHLRFFQVFKFALILKKKQSQNKKTVQTAQSNITRRVTPAFCTVSQTKSITLSLKKIQMVEFILIGQIKQAI